MGSTADKTEMPQLRFSEFSACWKSVQLGDVSTFSKGKGISKADIALNGGTPCIRYGELYTSYGAAIDDVISSTNVNPDNLVLSEGGEVIVPASGEDAKDIATASVVLREGVALGGDLNIIRSDMDGLFLASYLSGKKRLTLAARAQGNSVVHLYPAQLTNLDLFLPSSDEQEKIAAFLRVVDEKLECVSKTLNLLTDYKSGVVRQIFSQTLRFKSDDDNSFPDWKTKKLGEVFKRITRKNVKNELNVLTISAQRGLVSQREYFNKSVSAQDVSGYVLLEKGDFAYNKSYSYGYPMGAIKRLNKYESGVISTLYICFSSKSESESRFFEQYFEFGGLNQELRKIAQEGARNHGLLNVSVVEFFKSISIPYPHPDEQRKITDCLSAFDAKIDAVREQISNINAFKRGLLQQMFV